MEKSVISRAMRGFAHNFGVSRTSDEHFLCLNEDKTVGLMTIKEAKNLLKALIKKNEYSAIYLKDLERWTKGKDFYYESDKVYRVLGIVMQQLKRYSIALSVPKEAGPLFIILDDIAFVISQTSDMVNEKVKSLQQAYIV